MSTAIEERFKAAVNVIRGLPKNGSYQPSNEMMLKFYSYFKQATLGPCTQKKPPFWDLVNKAKWDSWHNLGNMPKERAMECYVDELKKIIETMSYTDNVANFMGSISELDGVDVNDLEAVAPDAIKKVRSQPNSPFASRENSPVRAPTTSNSQMNGHAENNGIYINGHGNGVHLEHSNGHMTEHSDDEYIDTVEDDSEFIYRFRTNGSIHNSRSKSRQSLTSDSSGQTTITNNTANDARNNSSVGTTQVVDILNQINQTVNRMNGDISTLTKRIDGLDKAVMELNKTNKINIMMAKRQQHFDWWPFDGISPNWFLFMVLWPFVAQKFVSVINNRRLARRT